MSDPVTEAADASLTPRPGRSRWWMASHAARGTWFLVLVHAGALAGGW